MTISPSSEDHVVARCRENDLFHVTLLRGLDYVSAETNPKFWIRAVRWHYEENPIYATS